MKVNKNKGMKKTEKLCGIEDMNKYEIILG